jgi:hypothetical protein
MTMTNNSSLFSKLSFGIASATLITVATVGYWAIQFAAHSSNSSEGDYHFAAAMYIVAIFSRIYFYSMFASFSGIVLSIVAFMKGEKSRKLRNAGLVINGIILFICAFGLARMLKI